MKKYCDQGELFAVLEGEPMAVMVGSVAEGRHGTGVAVSLLLIHKQESETQAETDCPWCGLL